jgi:hypothetical protein
MTRLDRTLGSGIGMTPRRWIEYLASILAGCGLYFLVLFPALPAAWQHAPFRFDRGLALAFACCVVVYAVIRLATVHAHRFGRS